MKTNLFLAALLGLAACGAPARPDPRIAQIQAQHRQLVAARQESAAQEKDAELVRLGRPAEARRRFAELLRRSRATLAGVGQLNPARAQEPAQVALVGTAATQEAELLQSARAMVAYNRYLITTARRRDRTVDSLNRVIGNLSH